MQWLSEHTVHLLLIAIYLVILARHAMTGRRNTRSLDDYLIAGRRMGGCVIALSFYATFMSTNTFIGAAGKSWDHGLIWCVGGIVLTSLAGLSWFVVAPRFVPLTRDYNSLTVADFLGTHYRSVRVRQLAASIVAFSSVLYLVAIFRGASIALESFLGLPYAFCLISVLVIVTTYTLLGGFESVVLTDALQGVLMLIGAVAIACAMLQAGGGWTAIVADLRSQDARLVSYSKEAFSAAMAYSLAVGIKYLVEPRQLSRFYGLRDQRALRQAAFIAPLAIMVTYMCLLPIGAMAHAIIPAGTITETDKVVPYLLSEANLLGPLTGTLFLLVLVSAAMSSIDSVLLVAASTIDRDLMPAKGDPDSAGQNRSVRRTRIWVIGISISAAVSALLPFTRDIVEMTAFSGSLYGACFFPVLVIGIFMQRRSSRAAVITMALGSITVIFAFVLRKNNITQVHEVYPGMLCGIIAYILATAISRLDRQKNKV